MSKTLYRSIVFVEIVSLVTTVVLAILWIRTGGSGFEPWLALTGAGVVLSEVVRRYGGTKQEVTARTPYEIAVQAARGESVSAALERAMDYARSIDDTELQRWLRLELCGWMPDNGMSREEYVPEYRIVVGQHYNEFMHPLLIRQPELQTINETRLRSSVYELEEMAKSPQVMLYMQDATVNALLEQTLGVHVVQFGFPTRSVKAILNRIKLELQNRLAVAP